MKHLNSHEDPSGLYGTVVTVIGAALALLAAFDVPITEQQQQAILGLAAALGPAVTAWLIRRKAWSPARHTDEMQRAMTWSRSGDRP